MSTNSGPCSLTPNFISGFGSCQQQCFQECNPATAGGKMLYCCFMVTPWSRLLEKPTVTQLFQKCHAFYGSRRFITKFKRGRQWSLIQIIPAHTLLTYFFSVHFNITFSSTPRCSTWPLPFVFPSKNVYGYLSATKCIKSRWSRYQWLFYLYIRCFKLNVTLYIST
jgi:hypothetical protein